MPGQMSLFPAEDALEEKKQVTEADANALDEMFEASLRYRDSRSFLDLIQFLTRFPKYSVFNCFLLYNQRPEASYVATAGMWAKRHNRRLRIDARPMVILAPMSPVRFLYDLEDTEGDAFPENLLQPFETKDRIQSEVFEKTVHNCIFHGIAVRSIVSVQEKTEPVISLTYDIRRKYEELKLDSRDKYLILLNKNLYVEGKFSVLVHGLGHIFCGHLGIDDQAWWHDRRGSDPVRAEIEAASVAYLVCRRKGLFAVSDKYLADYPDNEQEIPAFGLNAVFKATQYIEEMGKTLWKNPKKKSRYHLDSN